MYVHVNERWEGRREQGQTNNKAKQNSTPKAVTFTKKNELPWVGQEPTTLYTLDRALYQLSMYIHVGHRYVWLRIIHYMYVII